MADFISREAAIERFCNVHCGCTPEECDFKIPHDGVDECFAIRALKETPAADVRPVVRGKWEQETDFIYTGLTQCVICSACGSPAYFYDKMPNNFCPACGTDMREVQDEN